MRVRPPITFFGSKSKLAPLIIAQFPPHTTYVEAFAGSAAALLAKEPSEVEVLNDPKHVRLKKAFSRCHGDG